MKIEQTTHSGTVVLKLDGRLDASTSPDLETEIDQAIADGTRQIIIDFESLSYISSAGLRVVLKTAKALKRMEGRLTLCSMQDYVREVFEIAGFDTILPIAPSLETAMKDLAAQTA